MNATELLWSNFPALQLVQTGRRIRLFGKFTFVVVVFSVVALIWVPWRQTARGVGFVAALDPQERPQPVRSPATGVVSWVKQGLREGSYVKKNEPLIELQPFAVEGVSLIDSQIAAVMEKQAAAERALVADRQARSFQIDSGINLADSLNKDYEAGEQKLEQARDEVRILTAELEDKRNQLRISQEVIEAGLIPQEELFSHQRVVTAYENKVQKAENAVLEATKALESKLDEIKSKKQDIDIKNQAAEIKVQETIQKINTIKKELIDLRTKRAELNRLEVRAPRSGYIQNWYGIEGSDAIKKFDQLFVIVPDTTLLAVEMKVSGNDVPLVQEGDPVRLQFEGWPAVQFVGWPSVAVGTFGGKVNRVFPTDDGRGFFQVLVTPDKHFDGEKDWPDGRYLRQGVRANGWVLLRRVPLGYEIWRQLNGFPPIVSDKEPSQSKDEGGKVRLPKI